MGFLFGGGHSTHTTEQRLDRLHIQDIGYGNPIQICYGSRRITPLLICYVNFQAIEHTETQSSGGKGGGSSSTSTTYTYSVSVVFSFCEGQIAGFGKLWKGKSRYNSPTEIGFTSFYGSDSQEPWSYLTSYFPEQALSYRRTALLAAANYDLGNSNTIGSHSVEILGLGVYQDAQSATDAHVSFIITDFLSNPHHGVGFNAEKLQLTALDTYCKANDILISPLLDKQQAAHEWLTEFALIANSGIVWSEGKLKFIPLSLLPATNTYATYTPNTTIAAAFVDVDYGSDNGDLIQCTRKRQSDCFNSISIDHLKRSNDYNTYTTTTTDQANIEVFGLRKKDSVSLLSICTEQLAQFVANNILEREVYQRNTFQFSVAWTFDYLEPGDLITLTESGLGLSATLCRITEITDRADSGLQITAESLVQSNAHFLYDSGQSTSVLNQAVDVGSVN